MGRIVAVVDYGSGNTRSMVNALRKVALVDQEVVLTNRVDEIASADRLVLPGVGAFAECYRRLCNTGLIETILEVTKQGRPFLGVCVGMQILADEGHEFGISPGLGWIPGVTKRLEFPDNFAGPKKLPHVGWTQIEAKPHFLFEQIRPNSHFYFVHSYALNCSSPRDVIAHAEYGQRFAAAVARDNIFVCQFHPEKSALAGLRLLEAFCRWEVR